MIKDETTIHTICRLLGKVVIGRATSIVTESDNTSL